MKKGDAERQRAMYYEYKNAGLCVDCGDEPDGESVRCADCKVKLRVYRQRWMRTPNARKQAREAAARRYQASPELQERARVRARERYQELKVAGICVRCGQQPQPDDSLECDVCRSGVRRRKLLRKPPLSVLRPEAEPKPPTMRERILRVMRFMDFTRSQDISDALDLQHEERNNAQQMLGRLVRHGLAERGGGFTYRLTPAGIAESDRIRAGGVVKRNRIHAQEAA